jgi:hypothetical protein
VGTGLDVMGHARSVVAWDEVVRVSTTRSDEHEEGSSHLAHLATPLAQAAHTHVTFGTVVLAFRPLTFSLMLMSRLPARCFPQRLINTDWAAPTSMTPLPSCPCCCNFCAGLQWQLG